MFKTVCGEVDANAKTSDSLERSTGVSGVFKSDKETKPDRRKPAKRKEGERKKVRTDFSSKRKGESKRLQEEVEDKKGRGDQKKGHKTKGTGK